jgi:glutathione synthase/RimK-type ligase-like ATP-grasp enzyme
VKTLVICSSSFSDRCKDASDFEVSQLIRASKKFFDRYFLVYPPLVQHRFHQEKKASEVFLGEEDISNTSALIVRNTDGCEEATRLLALNLYANDCELLDPLDRFHGATATKSSMTLKGLKDQTIPSTFISFTANSAMELIPVIEEENLYPIVGKPTNGKHGKSVELINTPLEARKYIQEFYKEYHENSQGIIFQKYIEKKEEYRVLLLDGQSLGIAEKMSMPNTIVRNAQKGSKFIPANNNLVEQFAIKYVSNRGLLGSDIAVNANGECFLIESNRSPQWQNFEKATGVNVAEKIMETLEKRMQLVVNYSNQ